MFWICVPLAFDAGPGRGALLRVHACFSPLALRIEKPIRHILQLSESDVQKNPPAAVAALAKRGICPLWLRALTAGQSFSGCCDV